MSISFDTGYHARLRKKIAEYNEILASSNPPEMILDTPERKGFVVPGNAPYMRGQDFGGREYKQKKKGLSKALRTVGEFVKPLGKSLKPVKHALMEKAIYELGAPMYEGKTHSSPVVAEYDEIPMAFDVRDLPALPKGGRQYSQKKKGLAKALRTVGNFVAPLGKTIAPIKKALVERAVKTIEGGKRPPSAWIAEVKATRAEMEKSGPVSYKDAMKEASRRRKSIKV